MRWQTYKAVAEFVDGEHWTEVYPEELEFAASLVGFRNIEWRRFEGGLSGSRQWKNGRKL